MGERARRVWLDTVKKMVAARSSVVTGTAPTARTCGAGRWSMTGKYLRAAKRRRKIQGVPEERQDDDGGLGRIGGGRTAPERTKLSPELETGTANV